MRCGVPLFFSPFTLNPPRSSSFTTHRYHHNHSYTTAATTPTVDAALLWPCRTSSFVSIPTNISPIPIRTTLRSRPRSCPGPQRRRVVVCCSPASDVKHRHSRVVCYRLTSSACPHVRGLLENVTTSVAATAPFGLTKRPEGTDKRLNAAHRTAYDDDDAEGAGTVEDGRFIRGLRDAVASSAVSTGAPAVRCSRRPTGQRPYVMRPESPEPE